MNLFKPVWLSACYLQCLVTLIIFSWANLYISKSSFVYNFISRNSHFVNRNNDSDFQNRVVKETKLCSNFSLNKRCWTLCDFWLSALTLEICKTLKSRVTVTLITTMRSVSSMLPTHDLWRSCDEVYVTTAGCVWRCCSSLCVLALFVFFFSVLFFSILGRGFSSLLWVLPSNWFLEDLKSFSVITRLAEVTVNHYIEL